MEYPTPPPSRPPRVVIADGSAAVASAARELLTGDGTFDVVGIAAKGPAVAELIAATAADAVLLDIRIPGGGVELVRSLAGRWPQLRIVAWSVDAERADQAIASGAAAYLVKGDPTHDLRETLLRALGRP